MIEIFEIFFQIFSMFDDSNEPIDQIAEDIAYAKKCPRDDRREEWDEWEYHLPNRSKNSNVSCTKEQPFKDSM